MHSQEQSPSLRNLTYQADFMPVSMEQPLGTPVPFVATNPKDQARLAYARCYRVQDHGTRGTVFPVSKEDYFQRPMVGGRPKQPLEDPAELQTDGWTSKDAENQRVDYLYDQDPIDDEDDEADVQEKETREQLAEELLAKLDNNAITTTDAWEAFANHAGLDAALAGQEQAIAQWREHLRHSGRVATSRTVDLNPFGPEAHDTDFLDGFSIHAWK